MEILVIDDDDDVREAVREVLQAEGYHTNGASNGELARQWLDEAAKPPDLILLDLMMPVMDGWELLMWLDDDARFRETPIAIMSAHPSIQRAFEISRAKSSSPHLQLHGGTRLLLPKPLSILRLLSVAADIRSELSA